MLISFAGIRTQSEPPLAICEYRSKAEKVLHKLILSLPLSLGFLLHAKVLSAVPFDEVVFITFDPISIMSPAGEQRNSNSGCHIYLAAGSVLVGHALP